MADVPDMSGVFDSLYGVFQDVIGIGMDFILGNGSTAGGSIFNVFFNLLPVVGSNPLPVEPFILLAMSAGAFYKILWS